MKKHFRVFSIVFTSLLAIFINGCDEPMDTVVETVVNPQPATEPILPGGYRGYAFSGTLDHQGTIHAVAFESGINFFKDPTDITLASLGEDSLKLWDPYSTRLKETIPLEARPEIGVISRQNLWLSHLGSRWDGGRLNDFRLPVAPRHTSPIRSIASGIDLYATGSSDKTVHVWKESFGGDLQYNHLYTLAHEGQVWAVALEFTHYGLTLASGGGFEGIYLWDAYTGQPLGPPLIASTAQVESIAFGPNGDLLFVATGRGDGEAIHVWDLHTRLLIDTLRADGYTVRKVAVSFDGQLVAGGAFFADGPGVLLWRQK